MSHAETPAYSRAAGNVQLGGDALHGLRIVSRKMWGDEGRRRGSQLSDADFINLSTGAFKDHWEILFKFNRLSFLN